MEELSGAKQRQTQLDHPHVIWFFSVLMPPHFGVQRAESETAGSDANGIASSRTSWAPSRRSSSEAAPLLCAGAGPWRAALDAEVSGRGCYLRYAKGSGWHRDARITGDRAGRWHCRVKPVPISLLTVVRALF